MTDEAEPNDQGNEPAEPPAAAPDRELIEATIGHVRAALATFQQRRDELEAELQEVNQRILAAMGTIGRWTAYLQAMPNERPQRRLPAGEPARRLKEHFDRHPGGAFTLPELEQATGISIASLRSVVTRHGSGYAVHPDDTELPSPAPRRWVRASPTPDPPAEN
jgi:hypothetical protein